MKQTEEQKKALGDAYLRWCGSRFGPLGTQEERAAEALSGFLTLPIIEHKGKHEYED